MSGQPDVRQMMSVLRGENGIKKMMLRPSYEDDGAEGGAVSQAEVVADMVNIMRLDVKRLGAEADIDIEVGYMTPERAAELLQRMVRGESLELVDIFNNIEAKRERVIRELMDDDGEIYEHRKLKKDVTNATTTYDLGPLSETVDGDDDIDPEDAQWEPEEDDAETEEDTDE